MRIKRAAEALLGLSLMISMSAVPVYADDSEDFGAFEEQMFKELMESDYTTLHFALKDYEALGIEKPEVNIGSISWDDYEEDKKDAEEKLDTLHGFDYDSLSEEEQRDYKVLEYSLNHSVALNSYPYFDWAYNASEGIVNNLITTFTEFIFYQKEDIDDYLKVLESVPSYIDATLEITEKQAEEGYFLTDAMLDETEDEIDKFVAKTDDNELIKIFDENVDAFEGLTDAERKAYKEENRDIVLNSFIPSYQKARETLEGLRGSRKGEYNVSSLEDGEDYYLALAQYKTSTDKSIEEMIDDCNTYLSEAITQYYRLMQFGDQDAMEDTIQIDDPEEVLKALQSHMDIFPEGPEVTYKATYLDPSVASDSIVAYYMQPPIDDLKDNVIKINGDNVSDTNELYMTLAHEGFPGHLFQKTYYLNTNPAKIRTQLSVMGYQEGWGMYAEMEAMQESGLESDAIAVNQLNTGINYVLDAVADLGVNGLGWGTDDLSDWLDSMNLNSEMADSLYDFVTSEPGTILPYGVGLAEFELLKMKAMETQGKAFDEKAFNTVLLDGGDRPFNMVEEDVNAWLGLSDTATAEPSATAEPEADEESINWVLYGAIGAGIAAVGIIALVATRRYRKDDPFVS